MEIGLISAFVSALGKVLDKMPNYDQKKRKEYYELSLAYLQEMKKDDRDLDLAMNLRDQLKTFVQTFEIDLEKLS